MNSTAEIEDIEIIIPESTGGDFATIPSGGYKGTLLSATTIDKPDWKVRSQQEAEEKAAADKGREAREIDVKQWDWRWDVEYKYEDENGEWVSENIVLHDYYNRTWHENGKAAKAACALLNIGLADWEQYRDKGMSVNRDLVGKSAQLFVEEKEKQNGQMANYIQKVVPLPKPRGKTGGRPAHGIATSPDEIEWNGA